MISCREGELLYSTKKPTPFPGMTHALIIRMTNGKDRKPSSFWEILKQNLADLNGGCETNMPGGRGRRLRRGLFGIQGKAIGHLPATEDADNNPCGSAKANPSNKANSCRIHTVSTDGVVVATHQRKSHLGTKGQRLR